MVKNFSYRFNLQSLISRAVQYVHLYSLSLQILTRFPQPVISMTCVLIAMRLLPPPPQAMDVAVAEASHITPISDFHRF